MSFDREKLRAMEHEARLLGKLLDEGLRSQFGEKMGFTLFLFTFGDNEEFTYISNANRQDMINTVREWLTAQETGRGTLPSQDKN